MNSTGARSSRAFPPIRHADIIIVADVLDENGGNPKIRRVVVLTPDAELAAGYPIVAAAVTGAIPASITGDYILLPFQNPTGTRHPKTGLTKRAAVKCTWLLKVDPNAILGHRPSGYVPGPVMARVSARTAADAKRIGGWP